MVTKANGEAVGEYVTGRNGYAVVPELEAGFYTIKEVRAPDGYVMSGSPQTVEIREGKPAQVEFVNTRKESLQILKVDAGTGDPLPGAVFTITRTSGELGARSDPKGIGRKDGRHSCIHRRLRNWGTISVHPDIEKAGGIFSCLQ